jgi:integrase
VEIHSNSGSPAKRPLKSRALDGGGGGNKEAKPEESKDCAASVTSQNSVSDGISDKVPTAPRLKSRTGSMTPKKKQRSSIVEVGTGPAKVTIYTCNRKDGFSEFTLSWHEGGRRKRRSLACKDEARLVAQQITVRLTNGWVVGDEASKRDLELLHHCEGLASKFGVSLTAAMEEWASARKLAGEFSISEAVRIHAASRANLLVVKAVKDVAEEFVTSRRHRGLSEHYVNNCRDYSNRFCEKFDRNIADITVKEINAYLAGLKGLGPVSKNCHRRCLVTMFDFARRQGCLNPERKTAAALSETFKVPETAIEIFTTEEMERLLQSSNARMLPFVAIGAFAGIRSAEIQRLDWEDVKWDRGFIELLGSKAKTAARRLVPLSENLKEWLAPWREATGRIVQISDSSGSLGDIAVKAQIPGGWRQNGLRHSYISYRVALTGDVPRTALESGNSPKVIFRNYREVVDEESAKAWFSIKPPAGWKPAEPKRILRARKRKSS